MILACNHIEKKFNDEALFSDVSFHINEHECTALVGVNGTGKTTLLRMSFWQRILLSAIFRSSRDIIRTKVSTMNCGK